MAQVWFDAIQAAAQEDVPEPLTLALLASGLAGLGGYTRRRRAA